MTAPNPTELHLGQLRLLTGDVPRLAAFYRDVFRFGEYESSGARAVLSAGHIKLVLEALPSPGPGIRGELPGNREHAYWAPVFMCDNLEATLAVLAAKGVTMSPPQRGAHGIYSVGTDPDGNVFQVAAHR